METILIAVFSMAITAFGFLAYNRPLLARKLILKSGIITAAAFVIFLSYSTGQERAYYKAENTIADESDKFEMNLDSISKAAYNSDPHLAKENHIRGAMYFAILDIRHNQFKNVILAIDKKLDENLDQRITVVWVFLVFGVLSVLISYGSVLIEKDRCKELGESKEAQADQSTLTENK